MIEGRVHGAPDKAPLTRATRTLWAATLAAGLLATPGFLGAASASEDATWYERIDFSGDFRGRDEVFIRKDEKDRHRLRYRIRLGAETAINDHIDLGFRIATGPGARSTNQTLGSGIDFDPDHIFVDRAFMTIKPSGSEKPLFGDSLSASFGKMANPFYTKKIGPSPIMWDSDINPEGVAFQWGWSPCECWDANLDVAYFVIEENNHDPYRDPGMFGVQIDNTVAVTDGVTGRFQASYYALRKLDDDFFERNTDDGNIALTDDNHIDIVDVKAAVSFTPFEDWPVSVWGNFVINTSAEGTGEGKQDTGFGVGVTLGSKQALAEVGVGYFQIEADAVPAVLTDSNIFDSRTNGKGWKLYLTKSIFANTDFKLTAFIGDELDDDVSALQTSTPEDRVRIQTDEQVKF